MAVRLRLGEILRERQMTQKDFAEMSGLSEMAVSKIVNQPAQIRLDTIDTICDALNVDVTDLIYRVRIEPIN